MLCLRRRDMPRACFNAWLSASFRLLMRVLPGSGAEQPADEAMHATATF